MFSRRTGPTGLSTTTTPPTRPQQPITTPSTSLLQTVSNRATGSSLAVPASAPDSGYSTPSTSAAAAAASSASSPIHPSTNPSSFRSLLGTHRAVVAMFTSATCPPCRMIEPVFEDLAWSKNLTTSSGGKAQAEGQIAFVKVDLGVGMGSMVAREYGVTATPTFEFFLDGKKVRVAR